MYYIHTFRSPASEPRFTVLLGTKHDPLRCWAVQLHKHSSGSKWIWVAICFRTCSAAYSMPRVPRKFFWLCPTNSSIHKAIGITTAKWKQKWATRGKRGSTFLELVDLTNLMHQKNYVLKTTTPKLYSAWRLRGKRKPVPESSSITPSCIVILEMTVFLFLSISYFLSTTALQQQCYICILTCVPTYIPTCSPLQTSLSAW